MSNDKTEYSSQKSASKIFNNFLQESGIHGINKLRKSTSNRWRRFFWGSALLACGIYLIVTITKEIQFFFTYPTTSSIDVDVVDELPFPAVTICNLSPYNKSKMNLDEKSQNFYVAFDPRLSKFASPINWSDPYYEENGFFEPESKRYLVNNPLEVESRNGMVENAVIDGIIG
ncbi:hypothetical protein KUTeg_020844 [Tegillarca granosa]|uniref:Uncharacterized protein n=1 Tax=Tegillarca granosa TaxID=220873 RepID=A0ABQ9EE84_TEGGR|nr:hypothetical protein KUTeg_020844 [Tegillarca granosa]